MLALMPHANCETTARVLDRKRRHSWPCVYHFYQDPPLIVRGEQAWLFDHTGRRYLDCYSGVGVMNAGHSHPEILAAVMEQAACLQHTTSIYLTEPVWELAEQLSAVTPARLDRSFFCASGSEANEAAMLLATLATGRSEFVAFSRGLHGRTKAAMSATGLSMWRTDPELLATFHHAPVPGHHDSLDEVERLLKRRSVAAVIVEPVQGNGGIVVPPAGFFPRLLEICHRHGTLLIFDEVQTGLNRTGRWFAGQRWNVTPDIMTVAKALGNGWPIAAAVTTDELAAAYVRPGASTFGGNPLSCAAALAVIKIHQRDQLGPRAERLGNMFRDELRRRLDGCRWVGEIRGAGLMLGVELVRPDGRPAADELGRLLESLKDEGYLAGRTGPDRNVLTLMPPLIVEDEDLLELADALGQLVPRMRPID